MAGPPYACDNVSASNEHTPALGKRVANAAVWMSLAKVAARLVTSIRLVVLAALLPQSEIGLFGLAAVAIQLLQTLSETGLQTALIQKKDDVETYLGTVWLTQLVRGIILCAATFCLAIPFENFFAKPGVAELLYALSVVPIFLGFQNTGMVLLHRELRFKKVAGLQIGVAIIDLLVSLVVAWYSPTAMALVWGRIVSISFHMLASFVVELRWPGLSFSFPKLKELYVFGAWVFVSALLTFALVKGGDFVIGKTLTTADLAIYQIAAAMACGPIMEIMTVVNRTALPAYSRIQDQKGRLSSAFLRVLVSSSLVAALSMAGFCVLSGDFTAAFFNPSYSTMALLLPPLAVWGACRGLGAANSVLFQAIGRPALVSVFQALMLVLFVVALIPASVKFGLVGTAFSLAGIGLVAQLLRYALIVRVMGISQAALIRRLCLPLLVGLISAGVCKLAIELVPDEFHICRLIVGTCVLLTTFGMATFRMDHHFEFGLWEFATNWLGPKANTISTTFWKRVDPS